jgi:hypothetical protein
MEHNTHTISESPRVPDLVVDQGNKAGRYKTFSTVNPSSFIDKQQSKSPDSKNISRTPRTGEQPELSHLFHNHQKLIKHHQQARRSRASS